MEEKNSANNTEETSIGAAVFIGALFLLAQINFSALSPVIPIIGERFSLSGENTRMIVTIGFSGYMLGQLVWGPLSDRVGRSPVILLSLVLYVVVSWAATLSSTGWEFAIAYIAMGFFAAAYTSVGNAILKDRYRDANYIRMMGNVGIVMAAGPVVGPGISGLITSNTQNSWQPAFFFLSIFALVVCLGYFVFDRKVSHGKLRPIVPEENHLILRNWRFFLALVSFSLPFGIMISYLSSGPFILMDYFGISSHDFPIWYSLTTVCFLIGALIFRRFIGIVKSSSDFFWGNAIGLLGSILLFISTIFFPDEFVFGVLSLCLLLIGTGMVIPSGKIITMSLGNSSFGLSSAVMKFGQSACAVGVSACAAYLFSEDSIALLVSFYCTILFLAFCGAWILKRSTKQIL